MSEVIQVTSRQANGTGFARAVRREGKVPGVVYGAGKEPLTIAVAEKELLLESTSGHFFSKVFQLEIDGKKQSAIAKALQLHPVTDRPIHVDFMRIDKDSKVHMFIPIEFLNEDKSPGVKRGGVVNAIVHTLELICPANAIPEKLTVDLTGLEIGQSLHLDVLKLDKGVSVAHPERHNTLVTIVAPSAIVEETPVEAAAPAAEGGAETPAPASPATTK